MQEVIGWAVIILAVLLIAAMFTFPFRHKGVPFWKHYLIALTVSILLFLPLWLLMGYVEPTITLLLRNHGGQFALWTIASRTKNPDFGDGFAPAIPTLAIGQHTAIPRTDADTNDVNFIQAVANTAGFHFAWIEQGGTSLYPKLAQRVTNVEVLRIVLSIGGTEICHFQTWHDKAGNAPHLTNVIDPVTGVSVTFPDLNSPPFGGEDFQTNLIMPEPTVFPSRQFPPCSIIRPTETKGGAMGAVQGLTGDGLFIGQSKEFFRSLHDLAEDADEARHGGR